MINKEPQKSDRALRIFVVMAILFSVIQIVRAAAPNPGHVFTEVSGSVAQGDLFYGSGVDTLSALAKNATATRYLSNTGASNNPAWAQVDLTNGVTGVLPVANGGSNITVKALSADQTISSATMAKVTNLDQTVDVGTWAFRYYVIYRSDRATTGVKLGVNHSGTVTTFVTEATGVEATTAASSGAADQVHATFGLRSGGSSRAKSTTAAIYGSISVDTINADMLAIINGIMVVTVSGNLELYFGSEASSAGVQTIKKDSSLVLTKIQ